MMNVQWDKWIVEGLPARLRAKRMQAMGMILTAPIQGLYGDFVKWQKRMRIKAGSSPQVCMLQKIIRDTLGVDVVIREGDGKPVDFILQTSFTDLDKERQLFALLDRYKLAGKSYAYENKQLAFTAVWGGYVCQQVAMDAVWGDWLCEKSIVKEMLFITIEVVESSSSVVYQIRVEIRDNIVLNEAVTLNCKMRNPITGVEYTVASTPFVRSGNCSVTVKRAGDVSIGGELSRYEDEWYNYVLKVK